MTEKEELTSNLLFLEGQENCKLQRAVITLNLREQGMYYNIVSAFHPLVSMANWP